MRWWVGHFKVPVTSVFVRSVLALISGTASAQVFVILASPLLTRLFAPADFGVLGTFSSVMLVIIAAASGRYEIAIPIAKDESTAVSLVLLCLGLAGCTAVLVASAGWVVARVASEVPAYAMLSEYWFIMVLGVAVAGVYQTLHFWAVRVKRFTVIAQTRILQSVGQVGIQCAIGAAMSGGALGLLVGDVAGRGLGVTSLWRAFKSTSVRQTSRLAALMRAAVEYERFPRVMVWAALLNALAVQAPLLLLPAYFGPAAAGSYFLAHRTLILPASLVGSAVGQVMYGYVAANVREQKDIRGLIMRITVMLLMLNVPLYGAIVVAGHRMFPAVFGAEWYEAGLFARVLAPMVLVTSLASPLSNLLIVGDRLGESLLFTVCELGSKVLAIAAAAKMQSVELAVYLIAISGALLAVVSLWRFLRVANVELYELVRPAGKIAVLSSPFLFSLALVTARVDGVVVCVGAALTVTACYVLAFAFFPELRWRQSVSA